MGNNQSNERKKIESVNIKNVKIFRVTKKEKYENCNFVRYHLDDYVIYRDGNYKYINIKVPYCDSVFRELILKIKNYDEVYKDWLKGTKTDGYEDLLPDQFWRKENAPWPIDLDRTCNYNHDFIFDAFMSYDLEKEAKRVNAPDKVFRGDVFIAIQNVGESSDSIFNILAQTNSFLNDYYVEPRQRHQAMIEHDRWVKSTQKWTSYNY